MGLTGLLTAAGDRGRGGGDGEGGRGVRDGNKETFVVCYWALSERRWW